jgi:protein-S-isoprenylcysteine O-methyltransferase Ste14
MSTVTTETTQAAAATVKAKKALWVRAGWRWLTVTTIFCVLWVLYNRHPYYLRPMFAPFRPVFNFGFGTWLALGLPYAYVTVRRFSNRMRDMRDPALHWMLIARGAWHGRVRHLYRSRRVKTTILSLCVKLFYIPLMTVFFSEHTGNISRMWANRKHVPVFNNGTFADWLVYVQTTGPKLIPSFSDVSALFHGAWWDLGNVRFFGDCFYQWIFFVDCGWALMGYCLESQWLKNKTRSVEPTALGWTAALMCYPPFNDVTGTYLPFDRSHTFLTVTNPYVLVVFQYLTLAAFTIYAAATVAFGFKFSNLTNRGITDKGPYRFIRHPAYVCKCFAWWLEELPHLSFQTVLFLTGLNLVYALRAWTEERHLSQDPDYVAYKKKVPWVIIPGVY